MDGPRDLGADSRRCNVRPAGTSTHEGASPVVTPRQRRPASRYAAAARVEGHLEPLGAAVQVSQADANRLAWGGDVDRRGGTEAAARPRERASREFLRKG